jgi:hypothetical protein
MKSVYRPKIKSLVVLIGASVMVMSAAAFGVSAAAQSLDQHTTISADRGNSSSSRNTFDKPAGKGGPKIKGAIPNPSEPSEHPNNKK